MIHRMLASWSLVPLPFLKPAWTSGSSHQYLMIKQNVYSMTSVQFISVQFSHSVMSVSLWFHVLQHARLPCSSPTLGAGSNSCPLSQWCHLTISSSVVPFSFCIPSFPASELFPVIQFFTSGGQSIGIAASASVLPMNIQEWFPLEWTGWISFQSKGFSKVLSNNTVQKHQFFSSHLPL